MNVSISPENEEFIEVSIERGRYADSGDVLNEALRLLKRRDELLQAVNDGVDQLDRGEIVDGEVVFNRLTARYQPQPESRQG